MNDDIERRLRRVKHVGAPPELRARVLAAVADHLRPATAASWHRPLGLAIAVAASVLAGLALNYWVADTLDRRLAIVLGPPPACRQAAEIAAEIASITDHATGQWAYARLAGGQTHDNDGRRYAVRLRQMIQQFTVDLQETADETPEKNPEMDRNRRGSVDSHPADAQCMLRLDHRDTA
jgi:hypothetical protein